MDDRSTLAELAARYRDREAKNLDMAAKDRAVAEYFERLEEEQAE